MQYVAVSVLPFGGWFFTCSRARLYKNMEKENTISMGEMLRCLVGLPYREPEVMDYMGVLHWEPEVMDFPAWLGVNLSVYPGERVVCDSNF